MKVKYTFEKRRFPYSICSQETKNIPLRNIKTYIIQDNIFLLPLSIDFSHIAQRNNYIVTLTHSSVFLHRFVIFSHFLWGIHVYKSKCECMYLHKRNNSFAYCIVYCIKMTIVVLIHGTSYRRMSRHPQMVVPHLRCNIYPNNPLGNRHLHIRCSIPKVLEYGCNSFF